MKTKKHQRGGHGIDECHARSHQGSKSIWLITYHRTAANYGSSINFETDMKAGRFSTHSESHHAHYLKAARALACQHQVAFRHELDVRQQG